MSVSGLLLYCRPGFEKECAAEIIEHAGHHNIFGYVKSKPDSGYLLFFPQQPTARQQFAEAISFHGLIFARQLLFDAQLINDLPEQDRVTPILQQLATLDLRFSELYLETPDTNQGKQLSGFCKKFYTPLWKNLQRESFIDEHSKLRLHLLFLSSSSAYLGVSMIDNSSPWLNGIPRLKFPRNAPSRSTLKLEEAILTLLDDDERERYLCNGKTAVDLGASPGGWTWQLVQRGIRVQAVDNGPMDETLMESGLVKHLRADGFKFRPDKKVDWMVCDMVERPLHVTRLICRWLQDDLCRHSIFNLKLPMKQRYAVVRQCIELIHESVHGTFDLRIKQLYHDREEVTCLILRDD